jgi:hypothetical protein
MKNAPLAQICVLPTFFQCKSCELILKKIGWATFWSIFQTNSSGRPD